MVIDKLFFSYRRPARFCVIGAGHLACFQEKRKRFHRLHSMDTPGMLKMSPDDATRLGSRLGDRAWGAILRSDAFIFNIFDFDQLPRSTAKRLELAQWRLQKVFPEDISLFIHRVFHLGGKRLLSVLLPQKDARMVEDWFKGQRVPLTFLGNSTVELMNRLWGGGWRMLHNNSPRIMIELDHQLGVAVFQESNRPYFIRKFRCDSEEAFQREIRKTLEYVKGNYGRTPRSVAFFPGRPGFKLADPARTWRELDLNPVQVPGTEVFTVQGAV